MRFKPPAWVSTRRGKRIFGWVLTGISGVMLLSAGWLGGYPFYTDLRAGRQQQDLVSTFEGDEFKADFAEGTLAAGGPLTRLVIPRLGLDMVVVEGTSTKALAAGAGHYQSTPLPGEPGNVAIAGHRNMNGKFFGRLNELGEGDLIELWTPFAKHTYRMIGGFDGHPNPWITAPNDWSVVEPTDDAFLTLTTCHPYGSSRERLVARAELLTTERLA